jgi:hypothetical protein
MVGVEKNCIGIGAEAGRPGTDRRAIRRTKPPLSGIDTGFPEMFPFFSAAGKGTVEIESVFFA